MGKSSQGVQKSLTNGIVAAALVSSSGDEGDAVWGGRGRCNVGWERGGTRDDTDVHLRLETY